MPFALALAVVSAIIVFASAAASGPVPPSQALFVAAVAPALLAPLFWPRERSSSRRLLGGVLAPVVVFALLVIALRVNRGVPVPAGQFAITGLTLAGLLAVVHQAAALLERVLGRLGAPASPALEWSYWLSTVALWMAAATPLWLGPVADLGARMDPQVPTRVLALSPLAHLAAASGYDVLRGQWFYGHSSLGALQVAYPHVGATLLACAVAALALTLLAIPFGRRSKGTAVVEPQVVQRELRS
jgi:hypothetical protein